MTEPVIDPFDEPPAPDTPRLVVALLLGAVFAGGTLLTALAVVHLVVRVAVRDGVVVLALRAASTTVRILAFLDVSRTFVRRVLARRIARVAATVPSQD